MAALTVPYPVKTNAPGATKGEIPAGKSAVRTHAVVCAM